MLVRMRMIGALRVAAAVITLVAWLIILWGLYFAPISPYPDFDLEAGAAFGVSLAVYLPAMLLSVLVLVLLVVGAITRLLGVAAAVIGCLVAPFGLSILSQHDLLRYRPGLSDYVWVGIALSCIGLVVAFSAAVGAREAPLALDTEPTSAP